MLNQLRPRQNLQMIILMATNVQTACLTRTPSRISSSFNCLRSMVKRSNPVNIKIYFKHRRCFHQRSERWLDPRHFQLWEWKHHPTLGSWGGKPENYLMSILKECHAEDKGIAYFLKDTAFSTKGKVCTSRQRPLWEVYSMPRLTKEAPRYNFMGRRLI